MATTEERMEKIRNYVDSTPVIGRSLVASSGLNDEDINPTPDLTKDVKTKVMTAEETQSPFMRFLRTILRKR